MVQVSPKLKTFEDCLAQADELDGCYELSYGEPIEMPPESFDNVTRAKQLECASILNCWPLAIPRRCVPP